MASCCDGTSRHASHATQRSARQRRGTVHHGTVVLSCYAVTTHHTPSRGLTSHMHTRTRVHRRRGQDPRKVKVRIYICDADSLAENKMGRDELGMVEFSVDVTAQTPQEQWFAVKTTDNMRRDGHTVRVPTDTTCNGLPNLCAATCRSMRPLLRRGCAYRSRCVVARSLAGWCRQPVGCGFATS